MNEIPLKQVIESSLESIKNVLDADTVVGTPISVSDGVTVVPISKVSCGFTSGGVDYDSKANPRRETPHFGGANAAGVTVTPVTFLIIQGGDVRILNVNGTTASSDSSVIGLISDIVDKSPAVIAKIKEYFKSGDGDEKKPAEEKDEPKA